MPHRTIKFEVATPEKVVLKADISQVTLPTQEGELTILAKHTPLISVLKPGVIELVKKDGERDVLFVAGGFLEVLHNKVVVLADTAERAEKLDEAHIEQAKKQAEELLEELRHKDSERFAHIFGQLEIELAKSRSLKRWRDLKR